MLLIVFLSITNAGFAQRKFGGKKYGNTLNLGLGIGYYGHFDHNVPVVQMNYEFDVAKDFTPAPFITFYSYNRKEYRQTVVPIGVKGTYYFDEILKADKKWDFYLTGSLGATLVPTRWDDERSRTLNNNEGPGRL